MSYNDLRDVTGLTERTEKEGGNASGGDDEKELEEKKRGRVV